MINMQCNHCGKIVPNTSKVCMFCNQEIDPNAHYTEPVELGDSGDIYNDKKFDLKVVNKYLKEPANKKYIIAGLALIVVIILVFVFLIVSAFKGGGKSRDGKEYFLGVSDAIYDYLDDNILDEDHTGKATIEFTLNDAYKAYTEGKYAFDIKKNYLAYNAELNGNYSTEDVQFVSELLPFSLVLDGSNVYLKADKLYEKTLSSDLSNLSNLYSFQNYNLKKIVSGIHDALNATIKEMSISTDAQTINLQGEKMSLDRAYIEFDGKLMSSFVESFINALLDDSQFINELSDALKYDKNKTKSLLEDYSKTFTYNHSNNFNDTLTVSIYYDGDRVYRVEGVYKDSNTRQYVLDITTNMYHFDYNVDNKNIYSGSLSHIQNEMVNVKHGEIVIKFDSDDYITDFVIKYDDDKKPSYTKEKLGESIAINELSDDEFNSINTKFGTFLRFTDWFNDYRNIFLSNCTPDLECNCSDSICLCDFEDETITCPINRIK